MRQQGDQSDPLAALRAPHEAARLLSLPVGGAESAAGGSEAASLSHRRR